MSAERPLPPMIGQAASFLAALEHVSAAAPLDRPILIIGERGAGKELVAARAHFLSARWDQPYITVNCAALSESVLESELFGHEAGAFTGATRRHQGRFERADSGTLFLDEIATASDRVQEKLLRVVEYGVFERLGGDRPITVDVRVIAATNEDLPGLARAGRFRADLLDRLSFDVITLPPLRARWEDVPVLARHFAQRMAAELGAPAAPIFSHDAMAALLDHPWPGNVRELRNVVERAVYRTLAKPERAGVIDTVELDPFASPWRPRASEPPAAPAAPTPGGAEASAPAPPSPRKAPDPGLPFDAQVARFEQDLIDAALLDAGGHQGRAAEVLGLTYHQFRGLLRKHGRIARRGGSATP